MNPPDGSPSRPSPLQSLLGTGPRTAAPQGERPEGKEGEDWRADSLSRSRHSRLDAEVSRPTEDFDEEKAAGLCADIARAVLGDFAPALVLLPTTERRRAQALIAYAHTLFDFARQHGVEGERLAQINRWEWTLEAALSGQPVGQPIFLRMARENERRRWPVDALDELAACARRRALRRQPATVADAEVDALSLGRSIAAALLEKSLTAEIDGLASALVRLWSLQHLGDEVDRRRCPLPAAEVPERDAGQWDRAQLMAAARRECERLRGRLLKAPRGLADLPSGYRRAAVFALLGALRLLTEIEDSSRDLLASPPRLALSSRLGFLLRARWFGW
ncbi:MAG TPA: squalene/phytoene synthase family protein [Thermoanaerobaculia bacterium]|jgi:phytoene/squalene synthetase|nr:squalene/phytoene synthase family protein [Thermoanaerobaculia bacterium]